MIYVNDLKTDSENDNEKVMPSIPLLEPTTSYIDDLDFFKDFKKEFPAIVYNDAQTSKSDLLTEPTLNPQHIDKFNLNNETSLPEYDEEEQKIVYFNDLFPFNVIHPNDLKLDEDNDNNEINIIQSSEGINTTYLGDLVKEISTNIDGEFKYLENLKCWSLETLRRIQDSCDFTTITINGESEERETIEGIIQNYYDREDGETTPRFEA
ncbi:hypothetical protein Tco_0453403 [Tanacetum coccineum]